MDADLKETDKTLESLKTQKKQLVLDSEQYQKQFEEVCTVSNITFLLNTYIHDLN